MFFRAPAAAVYHSFTKPPVSLVGMGRINLPGKFRIGAKLGFCVAIGILLVAGMIAGEQINSRSIARLVADPDRHQDIVTPSITTESPIQAPPIAGPHPPHAPPFP